MQGFVLFPVYCTFETQTLNTSFPKMPRKKKASLGRSTKRAKRMKEVRANEDDNTYSQRLETEKNRRSIEYLNETSDHYNDSY